MKIITFILSLIMLVLSITPCSDGKNTEDQHQDNISMNHNHQNDRDDACPVTCICHCCGMSITYVPLVVYTMSVRLKISTELFFTYQSNYRFDFHFHIWQPPQLIS